MRLRYLIHMLVALIAAAFPSVGFGQWQAPGVPISQAAGSQSPLRIVSDGGGGAIAVWLDYRDLNYDIYAGRVDVSGNTPWTMDGVAVCKAPGLQDWHVAVSDGAGGAIIAWSDFRSGGLDIYAQRVDASGVPLWTEDGVGVCVASGTQDRPTITGDGSGGAIISWHDNRGATGDDIYTQRLNAAGARQWTLNGVALVVAAFEQVEPVSTTDGNGGAIVAFADSRNGNWDIYYRRVNNAGTPTGTSGGTALCTAAGKQAAIQIVSDGNQGAIIAWVDERDGSKDVYAALVTGLNQLPWTANGLVLCNSADDQDEITMAGDGSGGAIVAWQDGRSGSETDIYAQRVSMSGNRLWQSNGIAVCASVGYQQKPSMVADGEGGALIAWHNGSATTNPGQVQRIDSFGALQWGAPGVGVNTSTGSAQVVGDGSGGAVVVYSYNNDLFAQRHEGRYGDWGRPEPVVSFVADVPLDQGGRVVVGWEASGRDQVLDPVIQFYSVWRSFDASAAAAVAAAPWVIDDAHDIAADFDGRAIWHDISKAGAYWEWVGNQNAAYLPSYSLTVPTLEDSTGGNPAAHAFKVLAHDWSTPAKIWESGEVSGASIDNLAPPAPTDLVALRVGSDVHLNWTGVGASDLSEYAVYRADAPGVIPQPMKLIGTCQDPTLVDANAPIQAWFYVVTAYDIHDNESAPSNEAATWLYTGVGDAQSIPRLSVRENHPNPSTGATTLLIGLPQSADIVVEIFDVAGRRVRSMLVNSAPAGWRNVPFSGRDDQGRPLVSGVYFYRVSAGGVTVNKKMVIAR